MAKTRAEQIAHHEQHNYLDLSHLEEALEVTEDTYLLINTAPDAPKKILLSDALTPFQLNIEETINNEITLVNANLETKADKCFVIAMSIAL